MTVLRYNKPSVVIISADEYSRLKRREKRSLATEDLPEWLIRRIEEAEVDPRFNHLDDLLPPEEKALNALGQRYLVT